MTRATRFAAISGIAALVYFVFLLGILPVPLLSKSLPWWVLVSTGAYLLFSVGWGIFHFNDVPQAHEDLLLDIKTAKDYLRERGVTVD
ncbi:hypothetical protein CBS9595_001475 [Malassezia furfur]|nr:hypothetical protein CBS9595_001475 [Malassezia furfur]